MDSRFVVLALPFFALGILIELLVTRKRAESPYRLHDSLGSLSCGISQQALLGFVSSFGLLAYAWTQTHVAPWTVPMRSPWAWVVLLFLDDFCYYLYHRASHRVNFLWASHAVHHQSEEYNLSTALRQSALTGLSSFVFYLPLALLGFPLVMWLTIHTFNTLYQFWIHTRAVGKLGWVEWILNTPSHHRVHHGTNPRYIDKNHAGIFIIWDRLLGTFVEEQDEPVYGVVKPLASFDPIWANLAIWAHLWDMAKSTRRLRDKALVWIMPPEWRPADLGGIHVVPEVSRSTQRRYDRRPPRPIDVYAVGVFVTALAGGIVFLQVQHGATPALRIYAAIELLAALWVCAALVEQRRSVWSVDGLRLLSLIPLLSLLPQPMHVGGYVALALHGVFWLWTQLRTVRVPVALANAATP